MNAFDLYMQQIYLQTFSSSMEKYAENHNEER